MNSVVAFTPYGRDGASARVRVLDWLDRLAPDTVVYTYAGTRNNSPRTLASHPVATVQAEVNLRLFARSRHPRILMHRGASPFGWGKLERAIMDSADFSVYDFDDALQWEFAYRRLTQLFGSNSAKCIRCVERADRVIAGNDVLADWAGQFAREVVVIPSCVDPNQYELKNDYVLSDPPRLVWVGSSSAEKYLSQIGRALLAVHDRTGARLTVIGAPGGRLGELDRMTDRIPWAVGEPEQLLARFDIGLGPLTDDIYSRGKCAYKVLQYGAAGLPVVASPVGANTSATTSFGGRLAQNTDDWIGQVSALLEATSDERRRIGATARNEVERSFSFQAWSERWATAVGLTDGAVFDPNWP
jgi:glycosyltransferase involved in cell wall biosynthesis